MHFISVASTVSFISCSCVYEPNLMGEKRAGGGVSAGHL